VTGSSDRRWPLPSQSYRVRALLYLAEGLCFGGFGSFFLVGVTGVLTDIETGSLRSGLPLAGGAVILVMLYVVAERFVVIGRSQRTSEDSSLEWEDWSNTRRWRWVFAVAIVVSGTSVTVSVSLWGWWAVVFLRDASLLTTGTGVVGLLSEWYVLFRTGMDPI